MGYEIKFEECPKSVVYISETSKSGYLRGLDHIQNYRSKKHAAMDHNGRLDVRFATKIVRVFRDPLTRQCKESIRMQRCSADVLLNSKSE